MSNNIEPRIAHAIDSLAPDNFREVMNNCHEQKGKKTTMKKKLITIASIAACACLVLGVFLGSGSYLKTNTVVSTVTIDVNPGIEIKANSDEIVLACTPINKDAEHVLSDLGGGNDLRNVKLNVAVSAVVGALVNNGYLDGLSSAILVSVEDKDQNRAVSLKDRLTQAVNTVLNERQGSAKIIGQIVQNVTPVNGVSAGKAALVNRILDINPSLDFNALAALSVEELTDLIAIGAKQMPIGKAEAGKKAIAAAQTSLGISGNLIIRKVDPELDESPAHYEVELYHINGKLEFDIDAFSGNMLSYKTSSNEIPDVSVTDPKKLFIGKVAAKALALAHANVAESEVRNFKIWIEYDDGVPENYDIIFEVGNVRYEYEIALDSDTVLKHSSKAYNTAIIDKPSVTTDIITEQQALDAALNHAKVSAADVTYSLAKLDYDDGRIEGYEVEFITADYEYEYEINAYTGAVIEYEKEHIRKSNPSPSPSYTDIGEARVKEIVFAYADIKEANVRKLEIEKELEHGILEYEVSFKYGNKEYECKVDGFSGKILEWEIEDDD